MERHEGHAGPDDIDGWDWVDHSCADDGHHLLGREKFRDGRAFFLRMS